MPVQAGSLIELDVDKPAAGGRMLGRHEGQVVLAWGAVPGERIRARVERTGKGVLYAETVDVLRASPDRRPVSADWRCGGNVFSHIEYGRQLQLKSEIIQDAFRRIARVPLPDAPPVTGSPEAGYRMRARLHVDRGRLGFYREGTHQLCDPAATAQLLPSTSAWIARAEEILQRDRLTGIAGVEVAENVAGDLRACHLELHGGTDVAPFAALGEGLVGLSAQRADRADGEVLAGTPVITDVLSVRDGDSSATVTLRRDVRAFFQGNRFLLEALVRHVVGLVPAAAGVVDLYAGVGLFGLAVAAAGAPDVTLIEGDPISASDLKGNAEPFAGARVLRRSVEAYLAAADRLASAATFILDPPRTGLSKEALAGIIRVRPATIVYVSCDVATLARDTRALLDAGYTLGALRAFDLFPNTAHVETVASFEREGPGAKA
jgi:tRNA/tmRNA/rRNA uracil-C5-methylase (TrmA/RlmC/RlmD family)